MSPAYFADLSAALTLSQDADDLLFAESPSFHACLPFGKH
jgi:hypothetical protein